MKSLQKIKAKELKKGKIIIVEGYAIQSIKGGFYTTTSVLTHRTHKTIKEVKDFIINPH